MTTAVKMKVDTRKLDQLVKRLQNAHVKVGILASKGGRTPHPDSDLSMIEIAAVHEFGSPKAGVPQRSFIRSAFDLDELRKVTAMVGSRILIGRVSFRAALAVLGQWGVAQVQANIARGIDPPLAAATLEKRRRIQKRRKGRDIPLINTGRLRQSIAYEIVEGSS